MPYRRTIVSVFGRPIPVKKMERPTMENVLEIHAQYVTELKRCVVDGTYSLWSNGSSKNMGEIQRRICKTAYKGIAYCLDIEYRTISG